MRDTTKSIKRQLKKAINGNRKSHKTINVDKKKIYKKKNNVFRAVLENKTSLTTSSLGNRKPGGKGFGIGNGGKLAPWEHTNDRVEKLSNYQQWHLPGIYKMWN